MKKLIALLAFVVLSTVITFAADPAPAANNFKFAVTCPAAYIDHNAQDIEIGAYDLNNAIPFSPTNAVGTWNIYGDPTKTFTVKYTPPVYANIPGYLSINEHWTDAGFDDFVFGPALGNDWPNINGTGFSSSPYSDVSLAGTACASGHGVITLTIAGLTLDAALAQSGTYTLTYTFAITAF
jgi:hypothetical protein